MDTTQRLESLTQHRQLLRRAFKEAKQRILIVSPFISSSALRDDDICELAHKAIARGVKVMIYTDCNLNKDQYGFFKRTAAEGIANLHASGASVILVKGIHNKTLAMDKSLIADGSFNWLSAVRNAGGDHQREERTMVVEGEVADEMIRKELAVLENMFVVATAEEVVSALNKVDSKKTQENVTPEYLSLWLPFSLFIVGIAFSFVSMICLLFFGGAAWALIYRIKQAVDYACNQPDDFPGRPAWETTIEEHSDFVDVVFTADIRSTSAYGGVNYGDDDRASQEMDDMFRNAMNSND